MSITHASAITQLHPASDDTAFDDSPGQEFQLVHYMRDLTRAGVLDYLGPALGVLVNLASRANKQRCTCDPTVSRIAIDTGLSERAVYRGLKRLIACGAIHVAHLPTEQGQHGCHHNEYTILSVGNIVSHMTAANRAIRVSISANTDTYGNTDKNVSINTDKNVTSEGRTFTEVTKTSDQECSPTENSLRVGATRARTREATPPSAPTAPTAVPGLAPEPKRRKPSLKQSNPDLSADVQLALSQWEALTDHERNAKHCGQARQCVEKHGLADTLGAMLEMWDMPDGFWQTGNLTFNAIKERVPDYRRGTLTYKKPASQASTTPRRDYRHNIADGYSKAGYEGMTEDLVGKANLSGETCPYCGWDTMKHNPFCKRPITLTPQQQAGRDRSIARLNADLIKHGKPPLSIDNTPLGGAS